MCARDTFCSFFFQRLQFRHRAADVESFADRCLCIAGAKYGCRWAISAHLGRTLSFGTDEHVLLSLHAIIGNAWLCERFFIFSFIEQGWWIFVREDSLGDLSLSEGRELHGACRLTPRDFSDGLTDVAIGAKSVIFTIRRKSARPDNAQSLRTLRERIRERAGRTKMNVSYHPPVFSFTRRRHCVNRRAMSETRRSMKVREMKCTRGGTVKRGRTFEDSELDRRRRGSFH